MKKQNKSRRDNCLGKQNENVKVQNSCLCCRWKKKWTKINSENKESKWLQVRKVKELLYSTKRARIKKLHANQSTSRRTKSWKIIDLFAFLEHSSLVSQKKTKEKEKRQQINKKFSSFFSRFSIHNGMLWHLNDYYQIFGDDVTAADDVCGVDRWHGHEVDECSHLKNSKPKSDYMRRRHGIFGFLFFVLVNF